MSAAELQQLEPCMVLARPVPPLELTGRTAVRLAAGFDLQLFAAEDEGRTEDPTSRKLQKARQKGQVVKSIELPTAVMLLFGFIGLNYFLPYAWRIMNELAQVCLGGAMLMELGQENTYALFVYVLFTYLRIIAPVLIVAFALMLLANLVQVGWLFTLEPLRPKWNKISFTPKKIMEKIILSKETAMNFIKSLFKVIVISGIAYYEISENLVRLLSMTGFDVLQAVTFVLGICFRLGIKVALFVLVLALVDFMFQKRQHRERLKMTKQEIKDEHRQMEGDPMVKQRIRQMQQEIMRSVMMQKVPEADVVITNPDHYAVALKYDRSMQAPEVVAKGEGHIALHIKKIARENDVPLYENKPLAQALYREVDIGQMIPEKHFEAVAKVLAYIWNLRDGAAPGAAASTA